MVAGDAEEDRAHVTKGGKRSQAILHTSLQPWNGMRLGSPNTAGG